MKHNMWAIFLVMLPLLVVSGCATTPKPPRNAQAFERKMEVTGYCKCKQCCNWQRTWLGRAVVADGPAEGKKKKVGQTASGTKAKVGTIAADTKKYPFGTVMYIPGYGYGRVEDRGTAIQGEHIDLYFDSHKAALKWGRVDKVVKVWAP
ncbi:MAG: 3D domain-containing protein [Candidatus Hydrogenedentes bacterium]|nr:3D domain-containing protein [Candidatus Hydrogenedentota bacterium]